MKNRILGLFALAAVFSGCAVEVDPTPAPVKEEGKFVIEATIGQDTKLGYTETDKGYSATFTSSEVISVFFYGEGNALVGNCDLPIDYYSISDDGKKAKFVITKFSVPEGATRLGAYIHSGSAVSYDKDSIAVDLSVQNTLADAQGRHILFGTSQVADIKTENGVSVAKVNFGYKTSLLRFNVKLNNFVPMTNAVITISGEGIHNKPVVANGELLASSGKGSIVLKPASVNKDDSTFVAVACVWAADNFKDAKIVVENDEETFEAALELKKETFEAGKVYDVTRTLTVKPRTIILWKNDEAGSMEFPMGAGQNISSDFLSYADGKIAWTENTTGSPRTASLSFESGASVVITQLAPADFKGNWSIKSKRFNPNGTVAGVKGTDNTNETELVFGEPSSTEELAHISNIGIKGLYLDAVVDACVEIDYDAQTVKMGMLLDRRTAKDAGNGKYVAVIPECANKDFSWGGYNFAPKAGEFSATDYEWLWFNADNSFDTFRYVFRPSGQLTSNGAYAICGISCVAATGADASTLAGNYDVIYQANYDSKDAEGIALVRKGLTLSFE